MIYLWLNMDKLNKTNYLPINESAFDVIDKAERILVDIDNPINCPLEHVFIPGMYIREIFMPAGTLITSKIHKTEHPFFILSGAVSVYNAENDETILMVEGYGGITKPGTRRVLYIHSDTIWRTHHKIGFITGIENDWSAEEKEVLLEKIEDILIHKYDNPLLSELKGGELHV